MMHDRIRIRSVSGWESLVAARTRLLLSQSQRKERAKTSTVAHGQQLQHEPYISRLYSSPQQLEIKAGGRGGRRRKRIKSPQKNGSAAANATMSSPKRSPNLQNEDHTMDNVLHKLPPHEQGCGRQGPRVVVVPAHVPPLMRFCGQYKNCHYCVRRPNQCHKSLDNTHASPVQSVRLRIVCSPCRLFRKSLHAGCTERNSILSSFLPSYCSCTRFLARARRAMAM
jgi:hypothetical protein